MGVERRPRQTQCLHDAETGREWGKARVTCATEEELIAIICFQRVKDLFLL